MKHFLNLTHVVILALHWQNPAPSFVARITRTHKRSLETLFLCLSFFGGLCEGTSVRRFSCIGTTNFAQPATLLFRSNGGSSQLNTRGLHHV